MSRAKKLYTRLMEAVLRPTESAQLRRQVLFFIPLPLPVLAIVALLVGGRLSAPGWIILLSGSVAVAALLLAFIVQPSPLPEGLSAQTSVRRSLHRFRQITALRVGLALAPVAVGAGTAVAGGGLLPLFVALALAWPQLVFAMPTFFTITRARRAMEAWGTKAYLWAGLAQPARVEWPLVTYLMDRYRDRRARAKRGEGWEQDPPARDDADSAAGVEASSPTANGSDLPERMASSAESRIEPGTFIPGFTVPGVVSLPARRVLRTGDGIRRKVRASRGTPRPRAKN